MAKFWNFVVFQLGWFACVLGAANKDVLWAVLGTLAYISFHAWRSPSPNLDFQDAWPSPYLSPIWIWVLWALVATTINGSFELVERKTNFRSCFRGYL